MDTKILEEVGLTPNESKVYLSLIELGSSSATQIIQKAGLHRAVVYDLLERLIEKGLVGYVIKGRKKFFEATNPERLKEVMTAIVEGMDFVLIDAPAGISKEGVIPLAVADKVILVVNPELASMADALKTKALTEMLGRSVEGVILNRAELEKTEINRNKVSELLGVKVLEMIPEDANVRRSAAFKVPIVIRAPKSPAAIAFSRLAASLAGEIYKESSIKEEKEGFVDRLARSVFGGK
jgi:septum site-determining protein MinD